MGEAEPMDPRCDSRRELRTLRIKIYATTSSVATAKKPKTTSKAIAQCGKSLVEVLIGIDDAVGDDVCMVLPEALCVAVDAVDMVEDTDTSDLADAVDTDETDAKEFLT